MIQKKVEVPYLSHEPGWFGLADIEDRIWFCEHFYSCREEFHDDNKTKRRWIFTHYPKRSLDVIVFMERVESKLKVYPRSKFGTTQRNNIIWMVVSPWWFTSQLKRSLFTALLRASQKYRIKKDNFEAALFSVSYLKDTKYAVNRFFKGYTRYLGRNRDYFHWWDVFHVGNYNKSDPLTESEIKKLLVKPI